MQQTTVQIPKDAAQLAALRARREEHSAQIRELADRRQRLVSERFSAQANQNQAMVGELDAQTKELTTRLRRIESEKLAMDDAISAALRQGITDQSEHVMPVPPPPITEHMIGVPPPGLFDDSATRGKYERLMLLEGVGLLLLGFALWRWGIRRGRREAAVGSGQSDAQMRQAVDAIAIEVERISENQRYVTKLLSEQKDKVV